MPTTSQQKFIFDSFCEILNSGHYNKISVASNSMKWLLNKGDKVEFTNTSTDDLKFGDIILYHINELFIVHRYLGKLNSHGYKFLLAKGDLSRYFDPIVPIQNLIGKVVAIERKNKTINITGIKWRIINYIMGIFSFCVGSIFH